LDHQSLDSLVADRPMEAEQAPRRDDAGIRQPLDRPSIGRLLLLARGVTRLAAAGSGLQSWFLHAALTRP
jgi:hypothetical protein